MACLAGGSPVLGTKERKNKLKASLQNMKPKRPDSKVFLSLENFKIDSSKEVLTGENTIGTGSYNNKRKIENSVNNYRTENFKILK